MFASFSQRCGSLLLAFGFVAVLGCGSEAPNIVVGKVSYTGKPVTEGNVNFVSKEKGTAAMTTLDSSGSFEFKDSIPAGTYQVFITPLPPMPQPPGAKVEVSKALPIPKKARDPVTSGVTATVKTGKNDLAIELVD